LGKTLFACPLLTADPPVHAGEALGPPIVGRPLSPGCVAAYITGQIVAFSGFRAVSDSTGVWTRAIRPAV